MAPVRDFVVLAYGAFDGKMTGKTLLQKRLYFISVMVGADLGFDAHYYGPYSAEVADANSELKALGYVEETTNQWGFNSSGFEMIRYNFRLSPDGDTLLERKKRDLSGLWEKIQKAAEIIKNAGDIGYMELSVAAKTYFILCKDGGSMPLKKIAENKIRLCSE